MWKQWIWKFSASLGKTKESIECVKPENEKIVSWNITSLDIIVVFQDHITCVLLLRKDNRWICIF